MSTPQLRYSSVGHICVALLLLLLQLQARTTVAQGFGLNLMQVPSEDKSQAACSLALLQKYFNSGDALSGAVLCVSVTQNTPDVLEQLMRAFDLHQSYTWSILVTSPRQKQISNSNMQVMQEKPQCYFLIVEDLDDEDLEETFGYWRRMLNWNPLAQFVVYLASIEDTDEEMTDLMVEILLTFMSNNLYNVNVFGQSEENSFYYGKTVFPYHPDNNCGNRVIAIDLLDACSYVDGEESDNGSDDYDDEETSLEEETDENQSDENMPTDDVHDTETTEDEQVGFNAIERSYSESYAAAEASMESSTMENSAERVNVNGSAPTNGTQSETTVEEYLRARFEDKFPRDLSGCPIRAAYRGPWEPYIFTIAETNAPEMANYEEGASANVTEISYDEGIDVEDYTIENGNPGSHDTDETLGFTKLTGIEYQLVQTIAQRLHMSIDFKTKSTNVFHLFQQLIEGQIEMIVGGIDEDPSISQFVSSSTSYHQDELTWCVAKAKREHSLFNFLASFDTSAWLLLLLFIIVSSLAVLVAQHVSAVKLNSQHNYLTICLRMLGILLTQATNVNTRTLSLALRLVFFTAFILAFFFSNTYQSFLISTLTTPTTQAQISELEEIYGKRMTIMVSSENVRHLNKEGETFKYIREKFQICYNIVECLNYAADNEHIAVVVSRQHAFYNAHIQRNRLYCFDRRESLYVYPVAMLLPKKYHLLHHINAVIQHVIESGHMQKWARDLDMVRMIQEKIARVQEDAFKALTLAAFQGAFLFASLLLLLASGVLVLECLVYCLVVRWRTRLRLLRCLHRRLTYGRT
ncbi:uncharacterized protein LOC115761462 [Drosophila novamexicana]|uniref:uncharacterized protein LOC115761462 n=1 Tax=Drosophila novamexicana TaxID=47314 RepID=UPI0011E5AA70|nr:uncharacterized protein LOC115761462 [Drosophila novamexicana]